MRKYEAIWVALKNDKHVRITAPVQKHSTIKKMVIKEKYNDLAWKLEQSECDVKMKLEVISHRNSILEFFLRTTSI